MIGPNNVAVPTHFFKVVVGETESRDLELEAFVLPNEAIPDSTPLASFQVNSTKTKACCLLTLIFKAVRQFVCK